MSFFIFLTVVQAIIASLLVITILMQKSEGGGLGVGGSPAGFMSARGAADFMTRATTVLATLFVVLSIALAALAVGTTSSRTIDTSLERAVPINPPAIDPLAPAQGAPAPAAPAAQPPSANDPLGGSAAQ